MGRFPLETQKVGIGHRCGSASTDWHRALLARALLWLGTVRMEEQCPGDCLLSLLYSPRSKIHPHGAQWHT